MFYYHNFITKGLKKMVHESNFIQFNTEVFNKMLSFINTHKVYKIENGGVVSDMSVSYKIPDFTNYLYFEHYKKHHVDEISVNFASGNIKQINIVNYSSLSEQQKSQLDNALQTRAKATVLEDKVLNFLSGRVK